MESTPVATQSAAGDSQRKLLLLALASVALAACVLTILHIRSGDPGTAKRQPVAMTGDSRRANPQIEQRADRFVRALTRGDAAGLTALAYGESDRARIAALVADFGHRPGTTGSVQVDDMGGSIGVLIVSVPCADRKPQEFTVPFNWKRTSWVSSGWYATIQLRDDDGLPATACRPPAAR